ncbi:tyrosine phosphatase family protein [Indioceanicola profundi]|uniref:tyrosine phosphatase family protein n=1 Tax=Indioceanicola profundi TaxID=2220096 RepID=UPI00196906E0|nr:protein-tyrosine-phosphatase [Indioceanicola profundi]
MSETGFAPFRITVCGIDELPGHCDVGVSHVLSILDPGLPPPPAFGSFGEHVRLDLRFDDIIDPIPGKTLPEPQHVDAVLAFGQELLAESPGAHLLVHCHMGVSRSTASMALILAQSRPDRDPAEALAEVVRIRPQTWPNLRILEIGDQKLGLDGKMVAAARDHYARAAKAEPQKARFFREVGRGREVEHLDLP